MKTFNLILAGLILLSNLIACGTVGKNFNEKMVPEIRQRVTTKMQILDWFGIPFKEGIENSHTMWTYQFDKYMMGNAQSKDLVILFDNKDVVKAYRYTSNTGGK